jgi:hypothetical protein
MTAQPSIEVVNRIATIGRYDHLDRFARAEPRNAQRKAEDLTQLHVRPLIEKADVDAFWIVSFITTPFTMSGLSSRD